MAFGHKRNRNGHLAPFNRFGTGLQYTKPIVSNALLTKGGTRYWYSHVLCGGLSYHADSWNQLPMRSLEDAYIFDVGGQDQSMPNLAMDI